MNKDEIEKAKKDIDGMSQTSMASLWRFAPVGHPYFNSFDNKEISEYFAMKFKEKGGFTPAISKEIGWGNG